MEQYLADVLLLNTRLGEQIGLISSMPFNTIEEKDQKLRALADVTKEYTRGIENVGLRIKRTLLDAE